MLNQTMLDVLLNAKKDYLTNCYSRDSLNSLLSHLEAEYQLEKRPFCVFIIDVDHFKHFNDKYGHLCGDEVLKYFSSSIRLDLESEENIPFRFGGDEFIVVFPHKTTNETYRLAERLRKNIRTRHFLYKGQQLRMSFSGGIACFPEDGTTIEELIENADKTLYIAKKKGRARTLRYVNARDQKLIQAAAVLVILGLALSCFYVFRGDIKSTLVGIKNRAVFLSVQWKSSILKSFLPFMGQSATNPVSSKPKVIAVQEKPVVPEVPKPPGALDKIFLKSGRHITGKIIQEDDRMLKVELKLSGGKGFITLSKSDVLNVERADAKSS